MHPYLLTRRQVQFKRHNTPAHPYRLLLALDGDRLGRDALALALDHCSALAEHVDIVVTQPDDAATLLLREFLHGQAGQGCEYRLTITADTLASAVSNYLRRFPGIKTVVTANLADWSGQLWRPVERLQFDGYRFVCLSKALHPNLIESTATFHAHPD